MAEAAPQYAIRVKIEKVSRGDRGGPNEAIQVIGGGITVTTAANAVNIEAPINNVLEVNDAQVAGLLGYIGLLQKLVDTSAVETAIATLVAAS